MRSNLPPGVTDRMIEEQAGARKERERDLQAAEDILAKIVPHLVEHVTLKEAIADAIEAGRSQ